MNTNTENDIRLRCDAHIFEPGYVRLFNGKFAEDAYGYYVLFCVSKNEVEPGSDLSYDGTLEKALYDGFIDYCAVAIGVKSWKSALAISDAFKELSDKMKSDETSKENNLNEE